MDTRALIPRDIPPNSNDPADVPPATVGPPDARPGDPNGVVLIDEGPGAPWGVPPSVMPWSGWPAEWPTPPWSPSIARMVDVAWTAIDLNASITAAMPPYLVNASPNLNAGWLGNPDPDRYGSWESFWYDLWWDYMAVGEAFVLATARYDDGVGYPARFHVVPPWLFDVELDDAGVRRYALGGQDVTDDVLHLRYRATTQETHGHGPLEAADTRLVAAGLLTSYLGNLMASGGVPTQVLTVPGEQTAEQSADLQLQWVRARMSTMGLPAVLSGGVQFATPTLNPKDLALLDLAGMTEARIAVMLRVPPFMLALPSSGDSMVYNTAALTLDFHWRAHLRPLVRRIIAPLSAWLTPRSTNLELDRDDYVRADPLSEAQRLATLTGAGIMTIEEARQLMRLSTASPTPTLTAGVLQ